MFMVWSLVVWNQKGVCNCLHSGTVILRAAQPSIMNYFLKPNYVRVTISVEAKFRTLPFTLISIGSRVGIAVTFPDKFQI